MTSSVDRVNVKTSAFLKNFLWFMLFSRDGTVTVTVCIKVYFFPLIWRYAYYFMSLNITFILVYNNTKITMTVDTVVLGYCDFWYILGYFIKGRVQLTNLSFEQSSSRLRHSSCSRVLIRVITNFIWALCAYMLKTNRIVLW